MKLNESHYLDTAHSLLQAMSDGTTCVQLAHQTQMSVFRVRHHVRIARRLSLDTETLCRANPALSYGHARVLAGLPATQQIDLARSILAKCWSVRTVERLRRGDDSQHTNRYYEQLSESLSEQLGRPVSVKEDTAKPTHGVITLHYFGLDDFEVVCERLGISASRDV